MDPGKDTHLGREGERERRGQGGRGRERKRERGREREEERDWGGGDKWRMNLNSFQNSHLRMMAWNMV
jgi:hypothetical protein